MRRIGILMGGAKGDSQNEAGLAAFTDALNALGWTEGHNIKIDMRWAAGNVERMKGLAKELVGLQPDLLVGHTTQPVAALQRETATIPIVFLIVSDPVGSGFVASLPRPGGNITGFINIELSLGGKWIEVLKEVAPNVTPRRTLVQSGYRDLFQILPGAVRGRGAISRGRADLGAGPHGRRHRTRDRKLSANGPTRAWR